jgi:hypothetical protein
VFVTPVLVPAGSPFATTNGAMNLIQVRSEFVGTSHYYGAGAGRFPTANSVVADMLAIAAGTQSPDPFPRPPSAAGGAGAHALHVTPHFHAPHYLRVPVAGGDASTLLRACALHGVPVARLERLPAASAASGAAAAADAAAGAASGYFALLTEAAPSAMVAKVLADVERSAAAAQKGAPGGAAAIALPLLY